MSTQTSTKISFNEKASISAICITCLWGIQKLRLEIKSKVYYIWDFITRKFMRLTVSLSAQAHVYLYACKTVSEGSVPLRSARQSYASALVLGCLFPRRLQLNMRQGAVSDYTIFLMGVLDDFSWEKMKVIMWPFRVPSEQSRTIQARFLSI